MASIRAPEMPLAANSLVAADDDSDFPKAAPRTKLSGLSPNAEAIAQYKPDLVVLSYPGPVIAQLEKLGITVLEEPAVDTIAQAYQEIRELGAATGHAAGAAKVEMKFRRQKQAGRIGKACLASRK